jgi:hypothetical protein
MEERIFRDRVGGTVESRLLTKERNLRTLMDRVYSTILNRPVAITISEGEIGLYFDAGDLVVRDNNAQGVFGKDNRRAIFWRNGERFYEAVFARSGATEKHLTSIGAYLERDVSSPPKSEAEIKAWKESQ